MWMPTSDWIVTRAGKQKRPFYDMEEQEAGEDEVDGEQEDEYNDDETRKVKTTLPCHEWELSATPTRLGCRLATSPRRCLQPLLAIS